jgi:hypothetical protein
MKEAPHTLGSIATHPWVRPSSPPPETASRPAKTDLACPLSGCMCSNVPCPMPLFHHVNSNSIGPIRGLRTSSRGSTMPFPGTPWLFEHWSISINRPLPHDLPLTFTVLYSLWFTSLFRSPNVPMTTVSTHLNTILSCLAVYLTLTLM